MLMDFGNTVCNWDWKIDEKAPPGYSRVYSVYGGDVQYWDEERRFLLKPGHLYAFPSAIPYCMRQNRARPLDCTFLHLDILPATLAHPVEIPLDDNPALKHLFLSIAASIESQDNKLIHGLANVFETYCRDQWLSLAQEGPVAEALHYITGHMGDEITIADLCGRAGYNAHYFIRLFKRNVGLSPYRYITSYRLKEAKRMLLTGATVSEVAKATGYGDIKAFSRAFKNNFGLSPSDYRKAYTAQP